MRFCQETFNGKAVILVGEEQPTEVDVSNPHTVKIVKVPDSLFLIAVSLAFHCKELSKLQMTRHIRHVSSQFCNDQFLLGHCKWIVESATEYVHWHRDAAESYLTKVWAGKAA